MEEEDGGTCLMGCRCGHLRPTKARLVLLASLVLAALTTGHGSITGGKRLVRRLVAPAIVDPRAEKVTLSCEYDLHGQQLYSISWYRNDNALFKYSPSLDHLRGQFFEQPDEPDVRVSPEMSNSRQLVLLGNGDFRKNKRAYEGTYLCEVATEEPFFSDYAVANVTTAILPKSSPVIDGLAPNYNVGEQLDASCLAAPSLPPADLVFYINGRKINEKSTRSERTLHSIGEAATSSRLSVSLRLERHHFNAGTLTLTCRATLPGVPVVGESRSDYTTEKSATLSTSNQRAAKHLTAAGTKIGTSLLFLVMVCYVIVVH
ncbi:uncharacterized protein LOC106638754 [Copidosoma floridanum]|uniref:uncharacterized protein LOC106638754 n=1 Tax=Copidosoma floridanum TaxID=29053 RepID=UPI0006C9B9BE|nr:uncharacterized protein LOC106638754 [Copidosoma floridanum]